MKVIFLSKSDSDGGAAIAARRLLHALINEKIDAYLLVQEKRSNDDLVYSTTHSKVKKHINFLRFAFERFLFFLREKDKSVRFAFSIANTGEDITKNQLVRDADIIHLHWINGGFLSLSSLKKLLKLNKPIVWTFHDMWAFTGGCHHSYECFYFTEYCGNCQYLKNPRTSDLSKQILSKKLQIFKNHNINIVSVSHWLKERAQASQLFRNQNHVVIPNVIDNFYLEKLDCADSKIKLGIDHSKNYILFGAPRLDDPIKGLEFFITALDNLKNKGWNNNNLFEILLFGRIKGNKETLLSRFPYKVNYAGYVNQEKLRLLYNASTLTVVTSLYETFGQVISESMACSTPVVSFNHGGQKDIIEHKINGYLADYKSAKDVANGIEWVLNNTEIENLKIAAHQKIISRFTNKIVARQYINFYKSILTISE